MTRCDCPCDRHGYEGCECSGCQCGVRSRAEAAESRASRLEGALSRIVNCWSHGTDGLETLVGDGRAFYRAMQVARAALAEGEGDK